jgi:hypothetical protein
VPQVSHLTEDELVAWRDSADDDDGAVAAHLAECATCSAALESLLQTPRITELEFTDDLALATVDTPMYFKPADLVGPTYAFRDPRTAAKPFGPYAWRAWASIVGVVGIVWALMALIPTPKPSGGVPGTHANGTITLTGGGADPTTKVQWRSDVYEATQYQVVLKDDAGLVVFGLVTAATNASLPAEILERLQPERTYTWTVTALDASATAKASTSRSFSVPGPPR